MPFLTHLKGLGWLLGVRCTWLQSSSLDVERALRSRLLLLASSRLDDQIILMLNRYLVISIVKLLVNFLFEVDGLRHARLLRLMEVLDGVAAALVALQPLRALGRWLLVAGRLGLSLMQLYI